MAAPKSQPSLDGPLSMVNCQVSWSVNNRYIPLNDVTIIRNHIYESGYWKEHCFALTGDCLIKIGAFGRLRLAL